LDLTRLTIREAAKRLKNKEISCLELTSAYLDRIKNLNERLGAYITVCDKKAREQAALAQKRIDSGESISPLAGIPMGIKDNIMTKGILTSCASKILSNFIPPYDATAVKKLYDCGAVMLGKTNLDEFAMGSSTESSWYGVARNPWDESMVPGGSSGGSAVAVAAGLACFSLGTDTGGSIRQPASFCGVVGLKPTYGIVSRYGLAALASSFDQIGPVTRNTEDCALVLNAIAGHDSKDSTFRNIKYPDYTSFLKDDIKELRIGVPKEYISEDLCEDIKHSINEAIEFFEENGANVTEVSLPATEYAVSAYYILSCAEASSNLARFDGIKYGFRASDFDNIFDLYSKTRSEGFGQSVKNRILIGTYALSPEFQDYYKKAQKVRAVVCRDFRKVFNDVDIILGPTEVCSAYRIGEKKDKPLSMSLGDIYTVSVNMAGICALSVPCGKDSRGLPVGMQLIANHFNEGTLLRAAYAYEMGAGGIGLCW
jgi:aspartyl-tRNA(Asn)/glutamyl-tRNA(Gln) amidotransferase subunit A